MEVKAVDINQCILAKDQYVIRTLQKDILEDVKRDLIQMIDVKQRQKVCLTPVDDKNRLLKKKPENWNEIKDGKFMIINGQHSIYASKELQDGGCGVSRRNELRTWRAYIVWSLDATKLRSISKFYNITNHLDHAQPTWGNQLMSCRNIWIACKRPTETMTEASTRHNQAKLNVANYKVTTDHFQVSSGRRYISSSCNIWCRVLTLGIWIVAELHGCCDRAVPEYKSGEGRSHDQDRCRPEE